jgi:hypothetical protein
MLSAFPQSLNGYVETSLVAESEAVRNGFGWTGLHE